MNDLVKRFERVSPLDLEARDDNPNRGDVDRISQSVQAVGFFNVVGVREGTNRIIFGEHRWRAAIRNGAETVPVVYIECDEATAKKIMVADNRLAEFGERPAADMLKLLEELNDEGGFFGTGYDDDDLEDLRKELMKPGAEEEGVETDETDALEADVEDLVLKWKTAKGQLWETEEGHRIMIGDPRNPSDVRRLLQGKDPDVIVASHAPEWLGEALLLSKSPRNAPVYLFTSWEGLQTAKEAIKKTSTKESAVLVWDRVTCRNKKGRFWPRYSFIVYGGPQVGEDPVEADLWSIPQAATEVAGLAVEVVEKALNAAGLKGGIAYDPVGGTGSLGVAAFNSGYESRVMSSDPREAARALERLASLGLDPVLA